MTIRCSAAPPTHAPSLPSRGWRRATIARGWTVEIARCRPGPRGALGDPHARRRHRRAPGQTRPATPRAPGRGRCGDLTRAPGPETTLAPLPGWNHAPLGGHPPAAGARPAGWNPAHRARHARRRGLYCDLRVARPPGHHGHRGREPRLSGSPSGTAPAFRRRRAGRDDTRWWARVHGSGGVAVAAFRASRATFAAAQAAARATRVRTPPTRGGTSRPRPPRGPRGRRAARRRYPARRAALRLGAPLVRSSIRVEGAPSCDAPVRFCLFHLMASVAARAQPPSAPRGSAGPAIAAHDRLGTRMSSSCRFLGLDHPPAAPRARGLRALRLDAAPAAAARGGFEGARFSMGIGRHRRRRHARVAPDAAARSCASRPASRDAITADVAWAMARYRPGAAIGRRSAPTGALCEPQLLGVAHPPRHTADAATSTASSAPTSTTRTSMTTRHDTDGALDLLHAAALAQSHAEEADRWRARRCALADGYARPANAMSGSRLLRPRAGHRRRPSARRRSVECSAGTPRSDTARRAGDVPMLHLLVPISCPQLLCPDIDWSSPAPHTPHRSRRRCMRRCSLAPGGSTTPSSTSHGAPR